MCMGNKTDRYKAEYTLPTKGGGGVLEVDGFPVEEMTDIKWDHKHKDGYYKVVVTLWIPEDQVEHEEMRGIE